MFYYKLSELVIGYMSLLVIRSWLRDTIDLILSSTNFEVIVARLVVISTPSYDEQIIINWRPL